MKSKVLVCLVLSTIFIVSSLAAESVFSNYDFTFYRTVSESLAISDSSTIGFDYTGFGFVGTRNTSGLFLRIGIQLPYTTLTNIVEGISGGGSTGKDEDDGLAPHLTSLPRFQPTMRMAKAAASVTTTIQRLYSVSL